MAVAEGQIAESIRQRQGLFRLHVPDFHRREAPDTHMKQQQVIAGGYRFADTRDMGAGLSADIAEAIDIQIADDQVPPRALLFVEGGKVITAIFGTGRPQQPEIAHLRQGFHPRNAVPAMNPIVITFDGNARNVCILERLQSFDGTGKGLRQDLTGVK